MLILLILLLMWLALSALAGFMASRKGRSGLGIFLVSLILTPVVGLIMAIALKTGKPHQDVPAMFPKPGGSDRSSRQSDRVEVQRSSGSSQKRVTISIESHTYYDTAFLEGELTGELSSSDSCWVRPGSSVKVGDYEILGGMIYVGKNLPVIRESRIAEPALIDPSLQISFSYKDRDGEHMGYWPSYSRISPECRSAYLDWLASGRKDPEAYIGYVFLFFYGIERRVLADACLSAEAASEIPGLQREVGRLLTIYGSNNSFAGYAGSFLDFLTARHTQGEQVDLPKAKVRFGIPLALKVGVGRMAQAGRPLPGNWALAWVRSDPEIRLRTSARRCKEEFDKLFLLEYERRHGTGIALKNCKRRAEIAYHPASSSFGHGEISHPVDLPDVTSLVGPRRMLADLAAWCMDSLDTYSRWLGKNSDKAGTLMAAAYLPPHLVSVHAPSELKDLNDHLERRLATSDPASVRAEDVVAPWLPDDGSRQTKKSASEMAAVLAQIGVGVEPDVRFGGAKLARGESVVVFKLPEGSGDAPTSAYQAAQLLMHLASLVSIADGSLSEEEKAHIRDYVAKRLQLDESEAKRLSANLKWLLQQVPKQTGIKKRIEAIREADRSAVGRFLVGVAWADGRIEPDEVKILSKLYDFLGLESAGLHDDIQSLAPSAAADRGPVRVVSASPAGGYSIPKEVSQQGSASQEVTLDPARIEFIEKETAELVRSLNEVFQDGEAPSTLETAHPEAPVEGLDSQHVLLLKRLGERDTWDRESYEYLAEELGLFPGNALEMLNDLAYEKCDEPLLEGDDELVLNRSVYEEVTT
jgi:tellurite resistance protein